MTSKEMVAEMKAAAEAEVIKFASVLEAIDADLKIAEDKGFELGLAQAGIPASDKIYTEADLQAELSPLKDKIAVLQVSVDGIAQVVAEAVDAKQVAMVADFEAALVDDAAFLAKYKK